MRSFCFGSSSRISSPTIYSWAASSLSPYIYSVVPINVFQLSLFCAPFAIYCIVDPLICLIMSPVLIAFCVHLIVRSKNIGIGAYRNAAAFQIYCPLILGVIWLHSVITKWRTSCDVAQSFNSSGSSVQTTSYNITKLLI